MVRREKLEDQEGVGDYRS